MKDEKMKTVHGKEILNLPDDSDGALFDLVLPFGVFVFGVFWSALFQ